MRKNANPDCYRSWFPRLWHLISPQPNVELKWNFQFWNLQTKAYNISHTVNLNNILSQPHHLNTSHILSSYYVAQLAHFMLRLKLSCHPSLLTLLRTQYWLKSKALKVKVPYLVGTRSYSRSVINQPNQVLSTYYTALSLNWYEISNVRYLTAFKK